MARTITCDVCGKPASRPGVQHPVADLRFVATLVSNIDSHNLDLCETCARRMSIHWEGILAFLRDRLVGP